MRVERNKKGDEVHTWRVREKGLTALKAKLVGASGLLALVPSSSGLSHTRPNPSFFPLLILSAPLLPSPPRSFGRSKLPLMLPTDPIPIAMLR